MLGSLDPYGLEKREQARRNGCHHLQYVHKETRLAFFFLTKAHWALGCAQVLVASPLLGIWKSF